MTARALLADNRRLFAKLAVVAAAMFGFGYALVPMYRAICEALGINVLARAELNTGGAAAPAANTQVDTSRSVVIEFDANARGPWEFRPEKRTLSVHPGELARVDYVFRNRQPVAMTAQAIPSYAPQVAAAHFGKLECFCFSQWTLQPGEERSWPVVFVVDPKLPREVTTITLSYTFFEVGGRTPPAPGGGT
ncbi:cytochrome c oxidase assembly protein [Rubrivivax gelatinosus]|uniref:Cytochrome c oxidase assembly protein CtaG n=1 Tax=Rubrivivax gelatinosus (strain NBRC 100245 / IL144) TaxID=983917 RepID=I0HWY4_RUBGI|nr:cytochrome c oxidase assembly protein [Rubrivivax gelatinosus]MBG6079453.1 cytochrome c oxidase assembly protein subunit 11 [Rubrivivax gelatinosus]BAL97521.1 cytochrome c oxidase assembly protein CtaG [Rubrivivax gelatinosus IL144]